MNNKTNGVIGITAIVLSASTIVIMAELRTDGYNHFQKAVSELGSTDAPGQWVFNVFGYILPGLLISLFSINLLKEFKKDNVSYYPFYLLVASGILMCLAGFFPVDMENRQSMSSMLHTVGSLGSGITWMICALTLWWQLKKKEGWKAVAMVTFAIPFAMIVAMLFIPDTSPGLSQRIAFTFYFLYMALLAGKLVTAGTTKKSGILSV